MNLIPATQYPAPVSGTAADQLNPQDLVLVDGTPGFFGDDTLLYFSPSLHACFIATLGKDYEESNDDTTLQGPLDANGICHFWSNPEVSSYLAQTYNQVPSICNSNPFLLLNTSPEQALTLWEAHCQDQGPMPVFSAASRGQRQPVGVDEDSDLPFLVAHSSPTRLDPASWIPIRPKKPRCY